MPQKQISTYILKTTIISLLLCVAASSHARDDKQQAQAQASDSVALFRGVALSGDIVGLGQMLLSDYGQYEAALRINLKDKYFPIIEVGLGKADAEDDITNLKYKTSAPYGRIGVDFNLMKNKHGNYRTYAGFRYAYTSFKFDVTSPSIKDPVWGDEAEYDVRNVKANYHWAEAVFGVDAKICGPVRLGWSVRYKRRLMHDDGNIGNTWYVPGYGKQGGTRIGGTFNVIFEL